MSTAYLAFFSRLLSQAAVVATCNNLVFDSTKNETGTGSPGLGTAGALLIYLRLGSKG